MNEKPIYLQIRDYLLDLIKNNIDNPDFKLPSEYELADKFSVSRLSARNAILTLEKDDLIVRKQGKGTFIKPGIMLDIISKDESVLMIAYVFQSNTSPLNQQIAFGVKTYCNEHNIFEVDFLNFCSKEDEDSYIKLAQKINCNGLLLFPIDFESYTDDILKLQIKRFPTVFIDRKLPGLNFDYVGSNNEEGAYELVKRLYDRGVEHICCISNSAEVATSLQERINGYKRGVLDFYGKFDSEDMIESQNGVMLASAIEKKVKAWKGNCAFLLTSSGPYVYLLHILESLDVSDINKITIAKFDDEFNALMKYMGYDTITALQDGQKIGYTAAKQLHEQILGRTEKVETLIDCMFEEENFPESRRNKKKQAEA